MLRWCRLKFLTKGSSVDVDKCYVCAAKAGDSYGTGYYFLASRVYCSINCFSEFTKKEMEKALNVRPKAKSRTRSGNGRIKKSPRKNPRRSKSSKSRV